MFREQVLVSIGNFMKKRLAVGGENFRDMIRDNCYYVDKTDYIKAVMESGSKVLLITRPRRFGKTLFMDTLKSFLQLDFTHPGATEGHEQLFGGLRILDEQAFCCKFLGQYPVISITLKDVDGASFEEAYDLFADNLTDVISEYAFLAESPRLSERDKVNLRNYLSQGYLADITHQTDAKNFLKNLTAWLSKHFERQVVLLIDEYDVPLAKAAQKGYYSKMLELVRSFLGQVLKAKPKAEFDAFAYLKKAVLTGCLRVSKESVFTGINNPDVHTVCSQGTLLSAAIGFTEGDVRELLDYYGLTSRMDDVKRWYDGYLFAGQEIYCPWDVVNFCSEALELRAPETYEPENYWAGTSDNGVIAEFLEFLSNEDVDQIQILVDGGVIELKINDKLTYGDFVNHEPTDFWTLLLYSGYLTAVERVKGKLNTFRVKIPNEEIRDTFDQNVRQHFSKTNRHYGQLGITLAKTVMSGDADAVRKVLLPLLRKYVSVRDEATKAPPENYYQGFLSAMLACAGDFIANFHANSEAGTGFADILFTSSDQDVGVVIEIKRCDKREEMPTQAQRALTQIQNKEYAQGLEDYACTERYAYGIAFCNKSCVVLCRKVGA